MNWEIEGTWMDENMPDVRPMATSFFGYREGEDIDLHPAIESFKGPVKSGKVILTAIVDTWQDRGDYFPQPLFRAMTSIDGGNTWQELTKNGFIRGIYGKKRVRIRVYITSDFIDIIPFDGVLVIESLLVVSNQHEFDWDDKEFPETQWQIIKGDQFQFMK